MHRAAATRSNAYATTVPTINPEERYSPTESSASILDHTYQSGQPVLNSDSLNAASNKLQAQDAAQIETAIQEDGRNCLEVEKKEVGVTQDTGKASTMNQAVHETQDSELHAQNQ